jgi:MFS family permease
LGTEHEGGATGTAQVTQVALLAGEPPTAGPTAMQRRLWLLLPLTGLSISMVWGGVLQALMALQVDGFVRDTARQATVLGVVLTVGAISSVFVNPIVGRLSDRTGSARLGRRNIWVLGGALLGAVALLVTSMSPNAVVLAMAWAIALIPLNGFQAASSAAFPERVPIAIRARLTAVNGVASLVGIGAGAMIGNLLGVGAAYRVLAVQIVLVGVVFAWGTKDVDPPADPTGAARGRTSIPGFAAARDFWFVFAGRFLAFLAYGLATGLTLYALRDHFGVGDRTLADAKTLNGTVIVPLGALLLIVSALAGGYLADRLQRMKPFVVGASLLFVPACAVLILVPTELGAIVGMALIGLASGCYITVDGALITMVLPRMQDVGRDLGILNVASAGPQVIAPVVGGAVVALAGYTWLYVAVSAVSALGALAVLQVRSVR